MRKTFRVSAPPWFGWSRVLGYLPSAGNSSLYNSRPSELRNVTVSARVFADACSVPKNCKPSLGGRFGFMPGGMPMNFTSGPNVRSSSAGPYVPACAGPATNSQNG